MLSFCLPNVPTLTPDFYPYKALRCYDCSDCQVTFMTMTDNIIFAVFDNLLIAI